MKPTNVLTSGRIELPGDEELGDYSMSRGIYEDTQRKREEEISRAWYASGEEFEF
mgnify:CR=1 FL=1